MHQLPDSNFLVGLRKRLHRYPEVSGKEYKTSATITELLRKLGPDILIEELGGLGVAALFKGDRKGPVIMVRAELDALPIKEINSFDHSSENAGVGHMCGHDGHMTIAAGVAQYFSANRPSKGSVVVLFQPSEESGEGAQSVLNDSKFDLIKPDFMVALHNLPGFEKGEIVIKGDVFSMASTGMIINLFGKTSHAAEPENGISPAKGMIKIIGDLPQLADNVSSRFSLATVIHAHMGEIAFGTTPGEAVVMVTLRGYDNSVLEKLITVSEKFVNEVAASNNLSCEITYKERFPATVNDNKLAQLLAETADSLGYKVNNIDEPFRWSEDFGCFTDFHRGVLFGVGSGKGHPELHNPDYDFPDEIIDPSVKVLVEMCNKMLSGNNG